jgi:uncharacterized protein
MSLSLRDQLLQAGLINEKQAKQAGKRQKQEKIERAARRAQIKQLVEQNRIPKVESGDGYNFVDGKKIRRIPVDAAMREQLGRGALMIVRCDGRYEVVPAAIAERIGERDPHAVIPKATQSQTTPDENDPYKDFVVPDDLMW